MYFYITIEIDLLFFQARRVSELVQRSTKQTDFSLLSLNERKKHRYVKMLVKTRKQNSKLKRKIKRKNQENEKNVRIGKWKMKKTRARGNTGII